MPRPGAPVVLLTLAMVAATGVAALVVTGRGLMAVAVGVVAVIWGVLLNRWQRGIYGLLVFLPFAGIVTLALHPWSGPELLNPVLYKDFLFVIPAYFGFLGTIVLRRQRIDLLPWEIKFFTWAFGGLVIAQMANPGVPTPMVGLIGAKVWMFYLPLLALGFALLHNRNDLVMLLRLLAVLAVVPCLVGIGEVLLARVMGYQAAMNAIYGEEAIGVTQSFTAFQVGGGVIARIPSTFPSVTQYFGYTLAMLVPCYAVWRSDPSPRWRRAGFCMLGLVAVASLVSGARGAFVFVPLLLLLMAGFDRGSRGIFTIILGLGGATAAALFILQASAVPVFKFISGLFTNYASDTAYSGFVYALTSAPFGNGTGTNTGPARYAFSDPSLFTAVENYHAKIILELGIAGLVLLWGLYAAIFWRGWRQHRRLESPGLRACSAAVLGLLVALALNSFKGWLVDIDPMNVYLWLFSGVLLKLSSLEDRKPGTGGFREVRT